MIFFYLDCILKMDFLPVDNSANVRLQYTESYVLPTNINTKFTANQQNELHAPSHIQDQHHSSNHCSSQAQPVITIHEPTVKIGDDIDSYISRRTRHEEEQHPKPTFDQSVVNIHSVFKPNKPAILESHVESIRNKHLEGQPRQFSQTPIIAKHPQNSPQIDILDEVDTINCNQVSETSRQSKPSLHFRNLEQSSVNIVIDHEVKKKDAEQAIAPIANATQTLKSQAVNRHTRNLQKYEVNDPILQRSEQRGNPIDEDIITTKPHQDSFDIPSIQPASAYYLNDSKQYLRRNLNGSQIDQTNIIVDQVEQHEEARPIMTDKEIAEAPIFFQPHQQQDSLSTNKKNLLKRSIQKRKLLEPLAYSINSYHTEHIQQTCKNPLLEGSLLLEKTEPPMALYIHDSLEESMSSSPRRSQKRKLQANKLAESVPLHLQPDMEHSLSNDPNYSQKRKLVPNKLEQAIPLQLQPSLQHSFTSSPKPSLKRSLEAKRVGESMQIHLQDNVSQHFPDKSSSMLKRSIEQKVAEGSLILPPDINDAVEDHFVEAIPHQLQKQQPLLSKLDESIHLSERLETMSSPKNILPLKRDLKFNHVLPHRQSQQQQPDIINEVSHQAVERQNNHIGYEPRIQLLPQPESIPINYAIEEQSFQFAKKANSFFRNLKPSVKPVLITSQSPSSASDQGWNPTKKIFQLFKLSDLKTHHSKSISFIKSRISTASIHR